MKSKRQVQFDKSTYPEVIANPVINNLPNPSMPDPVMTYGSFLNFVDAAIPVGNNSKSMAVNTTIQSVLPMTNNSSTPTVSNKAKETECSRFLNSDNATAVLEKVLEELELIRKTKEGSATPEGIESICLST